MTVDDKIRQKFLQLHNTLKNVLMKPENFKTRVPLATPANTLRKWVVAPNVVVYPVINVLKDRYSIAAIQKTDTAWIFNEGHSHVMREFMWHSIDSTHLPQFFLPIYVELPEPAVHDGSTVFGFVTAGSHIQLLHTESVKHYGTLPLSRIHFEERKGKPSTDLTKPVHQMWSTLDSNGEQYSTIIYVDGTVSCGCRTWSENMNRTCDHVEKFDFKAALEAM